MPPSSFDGRAGWPFLPVIVCVAVCIAILASGAGCAPAAQPSARAESGSESVRTNPPPSLNAGRLERLIHERINEVRGKHDLPILAWASPLHPLADHHSHDMAGQDFFAHVNPQGRDVDARAEAAGMQCTIPLSERAQAQGYGENLYAATRYTRYQETYDAQGTVIERQYAWKSEADIARETVQQWMDSPGHRANLLSPYHRTQAIGIALREDRFFVTQVLC